MVGYVCKYTPIEIIKAFDEDVVRIEPEDKTYELSEAYTHPNMCSFMKGVLEYILRNNIDEVVLTTCCDSIKRLYDILKDKVSYVYILDLPRKVEDKSYDLYYGQIKKFIESFSQYKKKEFDIKRFAEILRFESDKRPKIERCDIAILGARFKEDLIEKIKSTYNMDILNLTCVNIDRLSSIDFDGDLLFNYTKALLDSSPCMRMVKERNIVSMISPKGIIYNTIKFCDFYSYEYAHLKNQINLPILKVETDFCDTNSGQMLTRIDAFLETLGIKKIEKVATKKGYFVGVDSGSTSTNVVIIDEDSNIISYSIVKTGPKPMESAKLALDIALKEASIKIDDISNIVATGYGRISIPFANKVVTEITCHAKGAYFIDKSVRTIIDIGGQDSKVIKIDDLGNVVDFVMNDKCSAGTGRFLEVMAKVLEIPIDEMGQITRCQKEDLTITSMCTVFAESEVISLIAQNKEKNDIIRAINKAVASKAISLIERVGKTPRFLISGGVAKNKGVVLEIEKRLNEKIIIPFEPQIIGALGAALIAKENIF